MGLFEVILIHILIWIRFHFCSFFSDNLSPRLTFVDFLMWGGYYLNRIFKYFGNRCDATTISLVITQVDGVEPACKIWTHDCDARQDTYFVWWS